MTNAGSNVAWPLPSRRSGRIEAISPLQTFLEALPLSRLHMPETGVTAFAFSPVNALSKLALDKWTATAIEGAVVLASGDDVRLMPTGGKEAYWHAMLSQLEAKKNLMLVPEWAASGLRKNYKVLKQHDEYIMTTDAVKSFAGGRNASLRNQINKARKICTVEVYTSSNEAEYLALNALWYRQNVTLKFRTYDKTSIDWLIKNWIDVTKVVPDAIMLGVRFDGKLISLNIGSGLCATMWTSYTFRYDREAPVKASNMLGYQSLASHFPKLGYENDGTADTAGIRAWKDRLMLTKIPFFKITKA